MATIRKKQCLVGMLGNEVKANKDGYVYLFNGSKEQTEEAVDKIADSYIKVAKTIMNLKDICEVDDTELKSLLKLMI